MFLIPNKLDESIQRVVDRDMKDETMTGFLYGIWVVGNRIWRWI